MQRFPQQFAIRFSLRTLFAITFLLALFAGLVIVPELHRASTFRRLAESGVVINAPLVVMFSGPQPVQHLTPEPKWHAFRQRINKSIGITTVPWYADGDLDVPHQIDASIEDLIRDLDDLRAIRNWDRHENAK